MGALGSDDAAIEDQLQIVLMDDDPAAKMKWQ